MWGVQRMSPVSHQVRFLMGPNKLSLNVLWRTFLRACRYCSIFSIRVYSCALYCSCGYSYARCVCVCVCLPSKLSPADWISTGFQARLAAGTTTGQTMYFFHSVHVLAAEKIWSRETQLRLCLDPRVLARSSSTPSRAASTTVPGINSQYCLPLNCCQLVEPGAAPLVTITTSYL